MVVADLNDHDRGHATPINPAILKRGYRIVIWPEDQSMAAVQSDREPELPDYGVVSEHPGKLDINFGPGVGGNWIHMNSWDYNETPDHVVIDNSRLSEFYVVDHGATFVPGDPQRSRDLAASDAGDFLFRWGNPCVSDSGDEFKSQVDVPGIPANAIGTPFEAGSGPAGGAGAVGGGNDAPGPAPHGLFGHLFP